ncbi:MAG: glycosyltransferase family 39 protein [Anaerolineae bacterium]|nr:glycosyltransferase family 39 protein [Anaerolineae bacterium]MDW8070192.1 glycosyltransferase family 39 protein [Anaerolineae bacterium]
MFSVAENLVRRGALHIDLIHWMGLQQGTFGLDGHLYSRKGIGMSLLLVPLVWLGRSIPGWGGATSALLFNSVVTAASASLLFFIVRQLGYTERDALTAGLVFGLATLAWPYAKTCFSEPLAGLCLLLAFWAALRFRQRGDLATAAICGIALVLAIATRYASVIMVPLFGAFIIHQAGQRFVPPRRNIAALGRVLGAFTLPLATGVALLALYNIARYGNPLDTGYLAEERFDGDWAQGIAGLLVSPGRGLFLYTPVLLLALAAAPAFGRCHRSIAVLVYAIVLGHVLLYGKWFMWHGGYAWGPRFMVPAVPFLVLSMLPTITWALRSPYWRGAFVTLVALSGLIQVLGLSVHFELFQTRLLDTGLPLFAPITFFDPRYSPLIGQLEFLRLEHLDFVWVTQGHIDWKLLAVLLGGSTLMGWLLVQAARAPEVCSGSLWKMAGTVMLLITLSAAVLAAAHQRWPDDLHRVVEWLNTHTRAADAIVIATPEETTAFADLYRGHAAVLGLNPGTLAREARAFDALHRIAATHEHVWWLPNWLPPAQSDIESWLMRHGFRVEERFFPRRENASEGKRLVLYFFPRQPLHKHPVGVSLGDEIMLQDVATWETVPWGDILPVELTWKALRPPTADYRVFVQLWDAAGERVAGADGAPMQSQHPTSHWRPGETIIDRHALLLSPVHVSGDYQLVVGMYLPESGTRLRAQDGGDAVVVTTIHVTTSVSR